ncbi:hypothetical protein M0R45_029861 [Rubus argutus]|uniref:Uncharacterized protein n=1 Tax=Rubus argutus TaxID=59490 RepID=A0AAW1W8Y1_RUBAR
MRRKLHAVANYASAGLYRGKTYISLATPNRGRKFLTFSDGNFMPTLFGVAKLTFFVVIYEVEKGRQTFPKSLAIIIVIAIMGLLYLLSHPLADSDFEDADNDLDLLTNSESLTTTAPPHLCNKNPTSPAPGFGREIGSDG